MKNDRKRNAMLRRIAEDTYSSVAPSYREADELARDSVSHAGKCEIIQNISTTFAQPITVLDLGCGTGRYFHCARNVKTLVGVDPSEHMLAEARRPVRGGNRNVHLVRSTLEDIAFAPRSFDLALCVGVFGLWCPVDVFVLGRIAAMLKPHGVLFFSAVEREPGPVTLKRRLASRVRPLLFGAPRRYVDVRLRDFTASEAKVRAMAAHNFQQVDITRWQSPTGRVDLHCVLARPIPLS